MNDEKARLNKLWAVGAILVMFVILSSIFFAISMVIQTNDNRTNQNSLISNEQNFLIAEKNVIATRMSRYIADLLYIKDDFTLAMWTSPIENAEAFVARQWLAFAGRKMIYDQIRWIDRDGNERIRINYRDTVAYQTPQSGLQNKKDRYYFTECANLNENDVYVSALDLNMENNAVEQPERPTMRFVTPVFDAQGERQGEIIINYAASDLIRQILNFSSQSQGNLNLLNSDGYWLINQQHPEKAWAFMYADRMFQRLSYTNPNLWATFKRVQDGVGFTATEKGGYLFTKVSLDNLFQNNAHAYQLVLGGGDWYLVSELPADTRAGRLLLWNFWTTAEDLFNEQFYIYGLILFISIVIGILFANNRMDQQKIQYFSEFDEMTGLYNRRAGLKKLNALFQNAKEKRCRATVCFIDVNGLKSVNDTLGHVAGDELIKQVAHGIDENIRTEDFTIRLGGDEFLIVFPGLNRDDSENVWLRIRSYFDVLNATLNLPYNISVSHGIETYECSEDQSFDSVIQHADEKMYQEKQTVKRNLQVIKPVENA
ncbi:MAG TPA: diguanylate cyclase [Candidatus Limiplasma sp.]|mgnify:CR=1 FL=1|nr:diguanylate cyclase [Candidatus Limiplasma sp.]HPS81169.1 diguanylate cyclase [Candidatus Limiplasma sp.]